MYTSSLSLVIQTASSLQEYYFCLNSTLCPTHSKSKSAFPLFLLLCFYSKSFFFFPATITGRESFNLRTKFMCLSFRITYYNCIIIADYWSAPAFSGQSYSLSQMEGAMHNPHSKIYKWTNALCLYCRRTQKNIKIWHWPTSQAYPGPTWIEVLQN